jgi:RHS repeat-associated protein
LPQDTRVVVDDGKTITETYIYDYAGRRISKNTDGKIVNYLVDTSGMLSHVLAEYDNDDNLIVYYTRGADLISLEREGKKHYYLYDGHNSVRMLLDEEGNLTDTYIYDAFGNLLDRTGTTENDYLYCGEQFNGSTGLYYLRARYMNPSTGTFISMDKYQGTTNDPISLHKYLYANANPVMYSDPTGYQSYAETMTTVTIMEILRKTTVINLAFAFSIITFLTIKVKVIENPPVIEDIEQIILDLIDGISGAGDVAEDIKDDVIYNVESDTKKGKDKTKGEGNAEVQGPEVKYPGDDPSKCPGKGWEWKGKGEPGSSEGSWYKEETGESLHPDLDHPTEGQGIEGHYDYNYRGSGTNGWRVFPDGKIEPK